MGQIVGLKAKPKRCNLNKLSQLGIPDAGEYILVSYDNSMTANGQGNFDRYIIGDGRTAATALELKYLDDSTRPYIVEEVNKAVADIQPIEITGDVTNAPDEEDLTSENQGGTDVLKFKDKAYNSALYSGLGRTYLRKNIVTLEGTGKNVLTQAMVNTANTIYHIQYDYDLNGQTITLPAGCVLEFDGGSVKNGTLNGNYTAVIAGLIKIFDENLILSGTFKGSGYPEWYGCYPDNNSSVCSSIAINALYKGFDCVELQVGTYYSKSAVSIKVGTTLRGKGKYSTIIFNNVTDDFVGVILGNPGGNPSQREWHKSIEDIAIEINDNNLVRTACLELGATTRSYVSNITLHNYNSKTSEFTAQELENPAYYSNYGLMVNGSTELFTMIHWVSIATIPIYMKTSSDLLSLISGYGQAGGSGNYGLAGVYGMNIGTNSRIVDTDFALGIYGVYSIGSTTNGLGYSRYENIRFEQLRILRIDDNFRDIGSTFFFDIKATTRADVIENCMLGTKKNCIHIRTSNKSYKLDVINSFSENTWTSTSSSDGIPFDYSIYIEGQGADVYFDKCKIGGELKIPEGYNVQDITGGSLYALSIGERLATINTARIGMLKTGPMVNTNSVNGVATIKSKAELSANTYIYYDVYESGDAPILWNYVWSYISKNALVFLLDIVVYNEQTYSKATIQIKAVNNSAGSLSYYSMVRILSQEGDDIIAIGSGANDLVDNKFNIRAVSTKIRVYNKYQAVHTIQSMRMLTNGTLVQYTLPAPTPIETT